MFDIFIMDMGGHDYNVQELQQRYAHAQVVRYYNNHLDTIRRCARRARTEYFWVISSCCDYSNFDFDYKSAPWESYQIHCWASGTEKFGDTFLINLAEFQKQETIELLEWYQDINWHSESVPRLAWPQVHYINSNLVDVVRATTFDTPYIWFIPEHHEQEGITDNLPDVCLWTEKQRNLVSFSAGNSLILAPKDVKTHLKTQLYDYPYIDKQEVYADPIPNIIFISYDEAEADSNYKALKKKFNVRRLHGVKGMNLALEKAAKRSKTHWYFAVFAKTIVHPDWTFDFRPDYLQEPKHYIFYAHNEANDLTYGYAGIIAYNRDLVLERRQFGVDYTMSFPHAVIPKVSAIARIGATPYQAWRSAFRECAKLAQIHEETQCLETQHRLNVWLTRAQGPNKEWILRGARDGLDFYQANSQNPTALKSAFDWDWLLAKFTSLYNSPDNPEIKTN